MRNFSSNNHLSKIDPSKFRSRSVYSLAIFSAIVWLGSVLVLSVAGMNSLQTFIPLTMLAILVPMLHLNRRFRPSDGEMSFKKRFIMNNRFGFTFLGLALAAHIIITAVSGLHVMPELMFNTTYNLIFPWALTGMISLGWIFISTYICMILFRKRMGYQRV